MLFFAVVEESTTEQFEKVGMWLPMGIFGFAIALCVAALIGEYRYDRKANRSNRALLEHHGLLPPRNYSVADRRNIKVSVVTGLILLAMWLGVSSIPEPIRGSFGITSLVITGLCSCVWCGLVICFTEKLSKERGKKIDQITKRAKQEGLIT